MIRWTPPVCRKKFPYQTEHVGAHNAQSEIVYNLPDHISWHEDGVTQTSSDSSDLTLDYVGLDIRMTAEWRTAGGVKPEVGSRESNFR